MVRHDTRTSAKMCDRRSHLTRCLAIATLWLRLAQATLRGCPGVAQRTSREEHLHNDVCACDLDVSQDSIRDVGREAGSAEGGEMTKNRRTRREDYLSVVDNICEESDQERAGTGAIAQRVGVSKGTVSSVLKELAGCHLLFLVISFLF